MPAFRDHALAAPGCGLGRALVALGSETELDRGLPPLAESRRGFVDLGQRRQARFVAEMLDRMRRCRARELEVLLPVGIGIDQIRIDVGTVKDVAGAGGVDDQALGDIEGGEEPLVLGFVV